jgi:hypothetical protein
MFRTLVCCISLLLVTGAAGAEEAADEGDKLLSGMSIVGNDEAPKSLVIVPWKSSGLGDTLDVSRVLDDGRQPVDKDVFMRELDYYQIRAGSREAVGSGRQ